MATLRVSNKDFRGALLYLNGLSGPRGASGPTWVHGMVRRLGFVQVDPVSAVERAQHHILFTRNPRYRQAQLTRLLEHDRKLFENWTHDAAILPIESYPYWQHYCARAKNFDAHPGYRRYFSFVTPKDLALVRRRIRKEGGLRPRDVGGRKVGWWDKEYYPKPSAAKVTMEYLWRTGELAVTRRDGREKVYDLAERVIPADVLRQKVTRKQYVDWICMEALERLGAAGATQVARFFDAVSPKETETWCRRNLGKQLIEIEVACADGTIAGPFYATASFPETLGKLPAAPRGMRLLNPFDPLIHDRKRLARVFGFEYALEMYVPAKKRKYGYYVMPILEGTRLTGRLDARVDRKRDALDLLGLWWEPGVEPTKARKDRLDRELHKLARFVGVKMKKGTFRFFL